MKKRILKNRSVKTDSRKTGGAKKKKTISHPATPVSETELLLVLEEWFKT